MNRIKWNISGEVTEATEEILKQIRFAEIAMNISLVTPVEKKSEIKPVFRKSIAFDFDGVIHSYVSKFTTDDEILDPPVNGIAESINYLRKKYKIYVFSSRCKSLAGRNAIIKYMRTNGIYFDEVVDKKPAVTVLVDDRAICFNGNPEDMIESIESFKPWNK